MPPDPEYASEKNEPAPAPSLDGFIGYNLKRAYVVFQTDFRRALGDRDLGTRNFSALALVVQFPNVTQSGLARMLGIERSGLVAIVDDLEARGYISRQKVPGDRRSYALVPTTEGQSACASAFDAVHQHEKELTADLTEQEKSDLISILQKIRRQEEV